MSFSDGRYGWVTDTFGKFTVVGVPVFTFGKWLRSGVGGALGVVCVDGGIESSRLFSL